MTLTYGEMFAGYGGLGMGVQSVLGGEMTWCAEFEAAPSKILAHHWPAVPNLGDVTKVDWASVPRVDVVAGGSPCQDLSHAGKRAGMTTGTRSNLWGEMREAVAVIRPRLVVWENVRGAYSACADSEMGRCPRCVGDDPTGGHTPYLRALGRVLGDFSDLGYDTRWYGLRAADVGAPHGRFRVFVFANPTSDPWRFGDRDDGPAGLTAHLGHERAGGSRRGWDGSANSGESLGHTLHAGPQGVGSGRAATGIGTSRPGRGASVVAADASGQRHGGRQDGGRLGRLDGRYAGEARQRERSREVAGHRGAEVAADPAQSERRGAQPELLGAPTGSATEPRERASAPTDWGQYGPAIARWERVLGRVAPAPTETGAKGAERLSPVFVEWMMGLPAGHVTDPAIGISRADQLKALGNGVVMQQAAEATRRFLADVSAERAA